ncbi:MAG: ABC transporter substrate-binding protein [Candidatus Altiarchaeia archaeon]
MEYKKKFYVTAALCFLLLAACTFLYTQPRMCPVSPREKVIAIGALLPLTGGLALDGASQKAALEIGVHEVNGYFKENGANARVTLSVEDTGSDAKTALEKIVSLDKQGIKTVLGPYSSAELAEVKPYADENGMVVISIATATSLALPGDNVLRIVPDDRMQAKAVTALMALEDIKVIAPFYRDDQWGRDMYKAAREEFVALNRTVLEPVKFDPNAPDYGAQVKELDLRVSDALKANKGRVAVYMMAFDPMPIVLEADKYPSLSGVKWYGNDITALNSELINDARASAFAMKTDLGSPIISAKGLTEKSSVTRGIEEKTGRTPNTYALALYDALWIAALALQSIPEGSRPEEVMEAATHIADRYSGETGLTILDKNGDRAIGDYDFWAITDKNHTMTWTNIARYRGGAGGTVTYLDDDTGGTARDEYMFTKDINNCSSGKFFDNVSICEIFNPNTLKEHVDVDYSIAYVVLNPGQKTSAHMMKNPEVDYVLEGSGVMYINDKPVGMMEGLLIHIPAGAKQEAVNNGTEDLKYFAVNQPAWREENQAMM